MADLWLLCGIAIIAIALIAVIGGSGPKTSSLDRVYARRDQRLGQATPSDAGPLTG